jgi:replicative DNA helicase
MTGRSLPQDVEVERAVLGAAIIDENAAAKISGELGDNLFIDDRHRTIYNAIVYMMQAKMHIDQLTLADFLRSKDQLKEAGNVSYLAQLASEVATSANIEHHMRIIIDKADARALIDDANWIQEMAYASAMRSEDIVAGAELRITNRRRNQKSDSMATYEEVMHKSMEFIERARNSKGGLLGADTGLLDLNEQTSGLQAGDSIILAARPSMGKTALALGIAEHAVKTDDSMVSVIFSLEMDKASIGLRRLSAEARINLHDLRRGKMSDDMMARIAEEMSSLARMGIYVDDTPGINLLEMRSKLARIQKDIAKEGKRIGVVVTDYLQLMGSPPGIQSREQEVGYNSRGLKGLAKEFNCAALTLSQLSRAVESRPDKRPQLSDLRDCLSANSRIVMLDGSMKKIKDVKAGDIVWGEKDQKIVSGSVISVPNKGIKKVLTLTTRGGRKLTATANHPIRTPSGWTAMSDLEGGDDIGAARMRRSNCEKWANELNDRELSMWANSDILWDSVVSIEESGEEETFDLIVPGINNFIADGIFVHNSGQVEQDADVVMFVYRPDYYGLKGADGASLQGLAEIIIGKQRNGPVGSIWTTFIDEFAKFENATHITEPLQVQG